MMHPAWAKALAEYRSARRSVRHEPDIIEAKLARVQPAVA
jgi:hypothetical protein